MRILFFLLALSACAPAMPERSQASGAGGPPVATAPTVLTWAPPTGAPLHAVGAEGVLERSGDCLYLATPQYRFLLVFPEGTRWDGAAGALRFGDQLLPIGSRVALSGTRSASPGAVAPGFDPRGCDAARIFRVNPWRAG
jgi:hypothetical protein